MHLISRLFKVNLSEKKWYKIILWWELRRIPYNVFLFLFLLFSIFLLSFISNDGYFKIIAGSGFVIGFYLSILLYFIGANVLYTTGCIFQLITRNINYKFINKVITYAFILGLIISFIATIIPILLLL